MTDIFRAIFHLLIPLTLISLHAAAQETAYDILTKKDGKILEVIIVENNPDEILYRKAGNTDGPVYAIEKSELLSIRFRNGEIQSFAVTLDHFYDTKPLDTPHTPAERRPPPVAKNEFQKTVLMLPANELRAAYTHHKKLSRQGKTLGLTGTIIQVAVNSIGMGLLLSNIETDAYGISYYADPGLARASVLMIVGGSLTGLILGPTGFVKMAKNGKKAGFIRKELIRRGENLP